MGPTSKTATSSRVALGNISVNTIASHPVIQCPRKKNRPTPGPTITPETQSPTSSESSEIRITNVSSSPPCLKVIRSKAIDLASSMVSSSVTVYNVSTTKTIEYDDKVSVNNL
jgi:hypothetical protein